MYDTGGALANTGAVITIGGGAFGAPVVAGIGAVVILVGSALAFAARRTRRASK